MVFLLYATCSVLPNENSQQIQHFLAETPDAELMPLPFEQTENTMESNSCHKRMAGWVLLCKIEKMVSLNEFAFN